MAIFLNSKATNHQIEQLIRGTRQRLVILTPILKFNARLCELLEQKQRQNADILVVYNQSRLNSQELLWIEAQPSVRTRRLRNLHGKCFLNEEAVILSSLNPYEFGQMLRNEMGMLVLRHEEPALFKSIHEDIHRQIGDSRDSRPTRSEDESAIQTSPSAAKVPDWQLAALHGVGIDRLYDQLVAQHLLLRTGKKSYSLTEKGKQAGGEPGFSKPYGPYFRWPADLALRKPSLRSRLRLGFRFW